MEIVIMCFIATVLLIPILTTSSRNVNDHRELMRRSLAYGLCMEMVERFGRYKPAWKLPGEPGGPPLSTMCLPVELNARKARFFDRVYLEQIAALGMVFKPRITRERDPKKPGLFLLTVSVEWKGPQRQSREVRFSRYCYAP